MASQAAVLTTGAPEKTVRYSFDAQASSATWRLHRLNVEEELSQPFAAEVDLVSAEGEANPMELLGSSCVITLARGDLERRINGIVHRVEHGGFVAEHVLARVKVGPALLALEHRVTSRMFQDKTVPEIVAEVLREGLSPYQRNVRLALERSYPKREYCLQYGESDLGFVSRLLEEEGIFYWFDQSGEQEEVILQDSNAAAQPFRAGGLLQVAGTAASLASQEAVREFLLARELRPTKVVAREYDWSRPSVEFAAVHGGPDPRGRQRELYHHDRAVRTASYDEGGGAYTADDSRDQARLRWEAETAREVFASGTGYVTGLAPGTTLEIVDHTAETDGKYLVLHVSHRGEAPEALYETERRPGAGDIDGGGDSGRSEERYVNDFTCIPLEVPFRPARTSRAPRIHGLQSAVVVGPAGEEIHTDQHGRIKVRFPWDRDAPGDDKSSCWLRVAQVWSGPGWGFTFIPRVGMEVLVAFVEGDPDRPLVVGCTYNGANPTPYALPAEKTKSTIKTSSSPGGAGFNELRFEDAAGAEEVFVHAQKDMNLEVGDCRSLKVGKDDTSKIGSNQRVSVGADQNVRIGRHRDTSVTGNSTEIVTGNRNEMVGATATLAVTASYQVSVGGAMSLTMGGAQTEEVGGSKTLNVGAASAESVAGNKSLNVQGNLTEKAFKNVAISAGEVASVKATKKLMLEAGDELSIKCGDAAITLKKNGDIVVKGKKISIKGTGDVVIKGSKVAGN